VDEPHRPLHGAKDAIRCRKEKPERVVPCLEKWSVEGRFVGI
jgi:hypothetical protein